MLYCRVNPKADSDKEHISGCLEQTVVDSINNFKKILRFEVVGCIIWLSKLDADKLLMYLEKYGNGYLYQKCRYVMERLQK